MKKYNICLTLNFYYLVSLKDKAQALINPLDCTGVDDSTPHITLIYTEFCEQKPDKQLFSRVYDICNKLIKPNSIKIIGISLFENDDFDVLKFDINSNLLQLINNTIIDEYNLKPTFKDYKPHITIAYLNKGKGEYYVKKLINNDLIQQINIKPTSLGIVITENVDCVKIKTDKISYFD